MARAAPLPRPRHVPQRTCVACRQGKAKRDLVRVVRTTSGAVRIDATGKQSGRGAYLCRSADCWGQALHRGVLPRALKIEALPDDDLLTLTEYAGRLALDHQRSALSSQFSQPVSRSATSDTTIRSASAQLTTEG